MEKSLESREFLKAHNWELRGSFVSDQQKGLPPPPVQEPYPAGSTLIDLIPPEKLSVGDAPLKRIISQRRSQRRFTREPLSLEELSFLLWATQGVQEVVRGGVAVMRTVPSGGARHAFETYLFLHWVEGVPAGMYRYLSMEHQLCHLYSDPGLAEKINAGCYAQRFVGNSAAVFIWSVLPYRMEWRYGEISPKIIALDAGHLCQNLYLACEAIGAGTCAIGAYHQAKMDAILGVDGTDEFTIYLAPVGKLKGA